MIIVDKPKLRFLLAGRQIDVQVPREYRKGRVYSVGTSSKASICRAIVLDTNSIAGTIRIKQHTEEKLRLLAKRPGPGRDYVTDPHLAMHAEPEAIDGATLERYAAEGFAGHARRKVLELRRQHVRSATIRLREAERREDWEAYRKALQDLQAIERMVA